jgi:hypothetical protein
VKERGRERETERQRKWKQTSSSRPLALADVSLLNSTLKREKDRQRMTERQIGRKTERERNIPPAPGPLL